MSESGQNKRIAKNTLMLYIRMLLIMGVTLYTSRIVLNALGVENFGIYNVVGGIVVMFSFLNGAMSQSTQRFLSYEMGRENSSKLQETFSAAMSIHIIIAIIILMFAETIGLWFLNTQMTFPDDATLSANVVYQCSILAIMTSILQVPYNAMIISHERMQAYAYISIVEVGLKLGVAYLLTLMSGHKLIIYAVLILTVTLLVNLIYRAYCKHNFSESKYKWKYDKDLFRSMSGYAAWSTVGSFAWIGKSQGCNLILNIFLGPAVNAAYGITNQVKTALNSFVQNFTTAVNPQIVKNYAAEDYGRAYSLVYYGCKVSFFLMLILAVPILMTTDKILVMWLKTVPQYTVIFTQLIIINSLFESFSYCMSTAIQASGKIKTYQLVVGLTTLLNLPIAWILLIAGRVPYTVFFASIVISMITLVERLWIMRGTLEQFSIRQFFIKVFFPGSVVGCVIASIYFGLQQITDVASFGFFGVIATSMAVTAIVVFMLGFSKSERGSLIRMFKNRI